MPGENGLGETGAGESEPKESEPRESEQSTGAVSGGGESSKGPQLWTIKLVAGEDLAKVWQEALGGIAQSVARFKERPGDQSAGRFWRIEAICLNLCWAAVFCRGCSVVRPRFSWSI